MSNITVVFRRVEINVLLFLTLKHAIQYITIESYSFSRSLLRDAFCYIPIRKSQCNASRQALKVLFKLGNICRKDDHVQGNPAPKLNPSPGPIPNLKYSQSLFEYI